MRPARSAVWVIGLAALSSTIAVAACGEETPKARPNVLVILCDDLRRDALGYAGNPHVKAPHIDRLAAEGFFFSNAFCTTSLCSPSRASILSGLYAHAHGVLNNFTEYPTTLPSFPRALQAAGYETAYIGKYHMGEENDEKRPGFDYFVTHKGQGKYFDTEFNIDGRRQVVPGYYTQVVTRMAVDWLDRPHQKPWLLMLGHKAPHSFYMTEEKYAHSLDKVVVRYPETAFHLEGKPDWIKQRLYTWHGIYGPLFEWRKNFPDDRPEGVKEFAAMTHAYWGTILSVDDSVGTLRATLDRMGQRDNTLILFLGDNGLLNGEHGMVDKRTMHEPSIRIPLAGRYPGLARPDRPRRLEAMVLTVDLAPSILDICGVSPLATTHGRSWKTLVAQEDPTWRKSFFYEYNYEKQFPYTPNIRGVRTDDWKYMHYPHGDGGPDRHKSELYDLRHDPEERHNLIDEPAQAERIRSLKAELARLQHESGLIHDTMPIDEGIKQVLPDQKIR